MNDASYARVDMPGSPGYFWLAESAGEGGNQGGDDPGTGDDSGTSGAPSTSGNPGANSRTGENPGTGGGNAEPDAETNPSKTTTPQAGVSATSTTGTKSTTAKTGAKIATKKAAAVKRTSIAKASVKLAASKFVYDGKVKTPTVTVKLGKKTLKKGRDYTVSYPKGRKKVGRYKVTVKGKGAYRSKAAASFSVVPAAPELKSVKAHKNSNGSSGFVAAWKKGAAGTPGYEVRWSAGVAFKKSESFSFASNTKHAKARLVALRVRASAWLGKTVYVQMRAFQTVGGKTHRSEWSTAKRVKLKK